MDPAAQAALLANPPYPDENIGHRYIVTLSVTFFFVLLTLALRLYTRINITKSLGWDDYTAILATLFAVVNLIFQSLNYHNGGGRHALYLSMDQLIQAVKYSNLAMIPFIFCTMLTKISIAIMVLRLINIKGMKYYMYFMIGSLVLVNGAAIVIIFSFCRPTYAYWDITVVKPHCWSKKVLETASNVQGAWSIFTDLVCTSVPIIMIWRLQMARNYKLAVSFLIGFGLITTICSAVRVEHYIKLEANTHSGDSTYDDVSTIVWISLEENIGLISMNLPALGKLFKLAQDKISGSMRYLLSGSNSKTTKSEGYYSSKGGSKNTGKTDSNIEMVGNRNEKANHRERERSLEDGDSYDFNTVDVKGHVRMAVSPA
ncbi:hypothetical protein GLAREA_03916 [Glarea lozoyensis ATCC 20868]|uniref:Rhodopsin domain-containing protein n=1 Tax=Glarea lozoyensis (strain ATCC 20868 / MF5171) TaxID=1116229 RepID=S3D1A8_GLAL2|nr:uncharacterized protein GLAREA_03916 [Glarea lozoyensis ATCC 20868]EPE30949.1 hypothetical protein GLAREA_03916 [Glarea lozoyensis ATCC 20868]